jgi:hypothetical protein
MRVTLVMAAVVIPLAVVLVSSDSNWRFGVVIAIFPCSFIFAIAFLYQRAALRELMAASPPTELVSFELLKSRIPKMQAFIGAAILLAGALMAWSIEWPFGIIPALVTAAFFIVIVRAFRKEHAILVNRGFAMGRVIAQKWQGRRVSVITYTFQDALGKETRGTAPDRCWIYEPKMDVPVFYDQTRPERNLPITGFFVYELLR